MPSITVLICAIVCSSNFGLPNPACLNCFMKRVLCLCFPTSQVRCYKDLDSSFISDLTMHVCMHVLHAELCSGTQIPEVAEEIRGVASADPVHRKLFVRGLSWETTSETLFSVSALLFACIKSA